MPGGKPLTKREKEAFRKARAKSSVLRDFFMSALPLGGTKQKTTEKVRKKEK